MIENCEKLGVFDDLNKVNPFEEVFRQAVEYKQTDPINKNVLYQNEDSLHTPQLGLKENVQTVQEHLTKPKPPAPTVKRKLVKKNRTILPSTSKPLIISNGVLITQPQIISITTFPQNNQQTSQPLRQKLRDLINQKKQPTNDDSKERSKAASSRYRQKTRAELTDLKKRNQKLFLENLELRNRITELEKIVASSSSSGNSAIHIEPSTVRFEVSIPKMVIMPNNK